MHQPRLYGEAAVTIILFDFCLFVSVLGAVP
jgi:hypothetical protein